MTVRERRFLSKGKFRAFLSPYLAEHNLLTVHLHGIFVLIRRSCLLCLTIIYIVHRQSSCIFSTQLWYASLVFGIVHAPCLAVPLVVCKLLFNLYLHEIMSWVRESCLFCLKVTVIALFIDISAVFCNIVLVR